MEMLKLDSFGLGKLQDIRTILVLAKRHGLSLEQITAMVNHQITSFLDGYTKEHEKHTKKAKKEREASFTNLRCEECGQYARLLPVNVDEATKVGGDYKSCGVCYSPKCLHTQFFLESVGQKRKQVGLVSE